MSQDIFSSIDPAISGTDLAGVLNDFKDALVSGLSGTSRPTELQPGGSWVDTTNDPTSWSFKLWTGVDDVEIFTIDLVNAAASVSLAVDSFAVRKVSADTVGAILELVKRRIASGGQVLSGDVVGEVRMVGRDNSSNSPIVAKIIWTATENQTSSAYGGTLSFMSTPAGTNTLIEHMRFIGGVVETVVPHKTNATVLTGQNVATTATIAQLSADKVLVEMTGSTATDIQGLNAAHASKVVTIHNRSSANVTAKHQSGSAAAQDRIALPESKDIVLLPQDSITLYYCSADSRWKILYASARFSGFTNESIYGAVNSWTAPSAVTKVRVTARSKKSIFQAHPTVTGNGMRALDVGGSAFAWGFNANGQLGVGDVTSRSSPVAVLGGLKFVSVISTNSTSGGAYRSIGLTEDGTAYAWGYNGNGQLGVGDVIPRSSPVAVLGGLKFKSIVAVLDYTVGLTEDGTAYGWGLNVGGQLGVGDVTPRSSPVAVLGGLKFREIFSDGYRFFGLTFDGTPYAWGGGPVFGGGGSGSGQMGLGDVNARSSPVAVLGGLKFRKLSVGFLSTYGLTDAGVLYAWGGNAVGQLGLGDVTPRSSPVAVLGGLTFQDIFSSADVFSPHVAGITPAGVAYAWGSGFDGKTGLGDTNARSSPVAVLGGLTFRSLNVGLNETIGITPDGAAYGWGLNDVGQLGNGDVVPRSSPVAVVGGLTFQEVVTFADGTFPGVANTGLTVSGKMYAWGGNALYGHLGVGDTTPRSSPVAVLSGLSLKSQDDSDIVLDIPVVGSTVYPVIMGAGPCFFGGKPIGKDVYKVEVSYVS